MHSRSDSSPPPTVCCERRLPPSGRSAPGSAEIVSSALPSKSAAAEPEVEPGPTEEEEATVRTAFEGFDTSGDGTLDKAEVHAMMIQCVGPTCA